MADLERALAEAAGAAADYDAIELQRQEARDRYFQKVRAAHELGAGYGTIAKRVGRSRSRIAAVVTSG